MITVPNQKIAIVGPRPPRDGSDRKYYYSTNNLEALQIAMVNLKESGLKLWLYLNKNQDNYPQGLSQKECEKWGIKKDSYYRAVKELISLGYLRPYREGSNIYIFYEMPTDEYYDKIVVIPNLD